MHFVQTAHTLCVYLMYCPEMSCGNRPSKHMLLLKVPFLRTMHGKTTWPAREFYITFHSDVNKQ